VTPTKAQEHFCVLCRKKRQHSCSIYRYRSCSNIQCSFIRVPSRNPRTQTSTDNKRSGKVAWVSCQSSWKFIRDRKAVNKLWKHATYLNALLQLSFWWFWHLENIFCLHVFLRAKCNLPLKEELSFLPQKTPLKNIPKMWCRRWQVYISFPPSRSFDRFRADYSCRLSSLHYTTSCFRLWHALCSRK